MHGRKEKKPSVRRTEALFILRKEAELARIVSKYKDRLCFHPPSPWENFKGRENINITKNFCPYLQLANLRSCNCDKQADLTEWKVIRAIKAEQFSYFFVQISETYRQKFNLTHLCLSSGQELFILSQKTLPRYLEKWETPPEIFGRGYLDKMRGKIYPN